MTRTTNRNRAPLWLSYDYSLNYPKQPSGQAFVLCALGFGFWTLQASPLSSTALAPRTTPATPQLAGWVGFCIGNHEPSRAPRGPIRLVVTYAAWSGDARASESRPRGQLILVRRKFGSRRLSRCWAGEEQRLRNRRHGQMARPLGHSTKSENNRAIVN